MSCFLVLFSALSTLFRLQTDVCNVQMNIGLGPNALKLFEYFSLVFLCLSEPLNKKGFKVLVRKRTKT